MVSQKALVRYLKGHAIHAGFVDRLKMIYRPFICPFNRLISYVYKDDVVVDIGCGSGQFCLLLGEFSEAGLIHGYEISKKLIGQARELCDAESKGIFHFSVFNGIDMPDMIKKADVIFLIDVLHHVPAKATVSYLRNIFVKMSSGSRLILKDIDAASPFVVFNRIHDLIFSKELGHEISLSDAIRTAHEIGFEIVHTEKNLMYVYPHYTIIARKP